MSDIPLKKNKRPVTADEDDRPLSSAAAFVDTEGLFRAWPLCSGVKGIALAALVLSCCTCNLTQGLVEDFDCVGVASTPNCTLLLITKTLKTTAIVHTDNIVFWPSNHRNRQPLDEDDNLMAVNVTKFIVSSDTL